MRRWIASRLVPPSGRLVPQQVVEEFARSGVSTTLEIEEGAAGPIGRDEPTVGRVDLMMPSSRHVPESTSRLVTTSSSPSRARRSPQDEVGGRSRRS